MYESIHSVTICPDAGAGITAQLANTYNLFGLSVDGNLVVTYTKRVEVRLEGIWGGGSKLSCNI